MGQAPNFRRAAYLLGQRVCKFSNDGTELRKMERQCNCVGFHGFNQRAVHPYRRI
jgi:hypothetical protein